MDVYTYYLKIFKKKEPSYDSKYKSYYKKALQRRGNWKELNDEGVLKSSLITFGYTLNKSLIKKTVVNANITGVLEQLSNKAVLTKKIFKSKELINSTPQSKIILSSENIDESSIEKFMMSIGSWVYVKPGSTSLQKGMLISNNPYNVVSHIKKYGNKYDWIISKRIPSIKVDGSSTYCKSWILFHKTPEKESVWIYDTIAMNLANEIKVNDTLEFKKALDYKVRNIKDGLKGTGVSWESIQSQNSKLAVNLYNLVKNELICYNIYNNENARGCFQLLTMDTIIDEYGKSWFLEFNTSPLMIQDEYIRLFNYNELFDGIVKITCDNEGLIPKIDTKIPMRWNQVYINYLDPYVKLYHISPKISLHDEFKEVFKKYNEHNPWRWINIPKITDSKLKFNSLQKLQYKNPSKSGGLNKSDVSGKIKTLPMFLGDKQNMYEILSKDKRSFKFLPITININKSSPDWKNKIKDALAYSKKGCWIVKPSQGKYGQGIKILCSLSQIIQYIVSSDEDDWVVSYYIDDPFLLKLKGTYKNSIINFNDTVGRKINIRAYILIKITNKKVKFYVYRDSMIFSAAEEYFGDKSNPYSNLTNLKLGGDFINKEYNLSSDLGYDVFSFDVKEVMSKIYGSGFYERVILPQIKFITKVIFQNSSKYLKCYQGNKVCWQTIAIDILPDVNWNLWLIEVNANPGMKGPKNKWNKKKLFDFADEILTLTLGEQSKSYKKDKNFLSIA